MKLKGSAFKISLGILKLYGIHQQKFTVKSIFRAVLLLSFVILQFFLASFIDIFFVETFKDFIVALIFVIFSSVIAFRLLSFSLMQNQVLELISEIEDNDEGQMMIEGTGKILKLMASLLSWDLLIGLSLSLSIIFFGGKKTFTIPQLFHPQNDVVYYFVFVLHYLQIIGIGSISHGKKI